MDAIITIFVPTHQHISRVRVFNRLAARLNVLKKIMLTATVHSPVQHVDDWDALAGAQTAIHCRGNKFLIFDSCISYFLGLY